MTSILMDVDAIIDLCQNHGGKGSLMHEIMVQTDPSYRRTSLGTRIATELAELGHDDEAGWLMSAVWSETFDG